jgi:hypothetical protein
MTNKISILVNTCDSYHDVLPIFFSALKEYWPDCKYPIHLNSEYNQFKFNSLNVQSHTILRNENSAWGYRFKKVINSIQSDYIISLFDDFILEAAVDQRTINSALSILESNSKVGIIYLYPILEGNKNDSLDFFFSVNALTPYRVNSAPALWRKDFLNDLLNISDDPWSWEAFAGYKKLAQSKKILTIPKNITIAYNYAAAKGGGIYRGKWVEEVVVKKVKKYNLQLDFSVRGLSANTKKHKRDIFWKTKFVFKGFRMVGFKVFYFILFSIIDRIFNKK